VSKVQVWADADSVYPKGGSNDRLSMNVKVYRKLTDALRSEDSALAIVIWIPDGPDMVARKHP